MSSRATSVVEAAYNHLLVFTEPFAAWSPSMAASIPSFDEMYVEPEGKGRRRGALSEMTLLLRETRGPVKLLLTGQKGAGKSWSLQHLARVLDGRFEVVSVSATDSAGTTLADAEVGHIMVLLCEALAARMDKTWAYEEASLAVQRWIDQLNVHSTVPAVPDNTDTFGVDLSVGFAKFASRMRSDLETRRLVRHAGADELVIVANAMLKRHRGFGQGAPRSVRRSRQDRPRRRKAAVYEPVLRDRSFEHEDGPDLSVLAEVRERAHAALPRPGEHPGS